MEENTPTVSLVSCMHFVRRGVAKAVPEKIELTEKELETIIKQTADELRITEAGEDVSEDEEETESRAPREGPSNPNDEFDFENYDTEDTSNPVGIGSVATLPNLGDLSENVQIRTEGPDSDEEDDIIKPDDNLLLVGHVESDASVLEVYIFNKEEGSFYVHHDIILPWFPLCIEWLSHDPTDAQPGNLCALGGMDPVIQVWDLDIENCLEPAFKLGKKPNKKKKIKRVGHKDAVLDLSWNRNFTHVLASGSADNTVLLWDLDQGAPHTKLDYFQDKVQSVSFHPLEAQTLAAGACDGHVRVTDCRAAETHRAWSLPPEIERVVWDTLNPYCLASDGLSRGGDAPRLVTTSRDRARRLGHAQPVLPRGTYTQYIDRCMLTLSAYSRAAIGSSIASKAGAFNGRVRVTDCRAAETHRAWALPPEIERVVWDTLNPYCLASRPSEIERVVWDTLNPYCLAMSNNEGKVAYIDCRQDAPLWTLSAHDKEITGLILSEHVPGLMITVSTDGKLKTWDITSTGPVQVSERSTRIGQALCAAACPEAPFSLAVGGDNKQCCIEMLDLADNEQVSNRFGSRPLVAVTTEPSAMDT